MQFMQTTPSRDVFFIKDHIYIIIMNDRDPTQAINTWMMQTPSINFGATQSFKQYSSSPCLLPDMRQDMRGHRRLDCYSSLLGIDE